MQKAADTVPSGSSVNVLQGNYPERVSVTRNNITFLANGEVTTLGFTIQADEITVHGFTITSLLDHIQKGTGIWVETGRNGIVESNKFLYNTWGGIHLSGGANNPSQTNGWVIRNNYFHRNAMFAAEIKGQNHLIENNEVSHSIQFHPCSNSTEPWLDADAFRFHGSGHIFRKNYIHDMPYGNPGYDQTICSIENLANLDNDYVLDSHTDCFQTYGESEIAGYDILFENNYCALPPASEWTAEDVGAKAFQGTGDTHSLIFRNNLIVADFLSNFENGCHDLSFIHNTFVGEDPTWSQGLKFTNCLENIEVKNNVFYGQENGVGHIFSNNSSINSGYNCVYRKGGPPFYPPDQGDVWNVDPLLDSNYHLLPDSPCIDSGLDLGLSADFDGIFRPQGNGFDIGAFETNTP
jgi:parallel beta-helix repeat protein